MSLFYRELLPISSGFLKILAHSIAEGTYGCAKTFKKLSKEAARLYEINLLFRLYPNEFKTWPIDGIESRRKSTTAGFVSGSVLTNRKPLTIVDFRRFEPAQKSILELRTVYYGIITTSNKNQLNEIIKIKNRKKNDLPYI